MDNMKKIILHWHKHGMKYQNLSTILFDFLPSYIVKSISQRSSISPLDSAKFALSFFFLTFLGPGHLVALWSCLPQLKQFPLNFFLGGLLFGPDAFFLFFNFVGSFSTIFTPDIAELPRDLFYVALLSSSILKLIMRSSTIISLHLCFK